MQDLIEQAKKKIDEEVEFLPAPIDHESDMQQKGILAKYQSNEDLVYFSDTMLKSLPEKLRIQTFIHELAHVKDFRACVRNGLLKILEPHSQPIFHEPWKQLKDILHNATEFQMSNFLNSEFGCQLPSNYYVEHCLHEPPSPSLSLIPSIEYLCFGENSDLRAQFGIKLNKSLQSRWLQVGSLLKTLGFADAQSFEEGFLELTDYLGFKVKVKTKPVEGIIRKSFKILQNSDEAQIKVFEMIDFGPPKYDLINE
jgi:hypothetical protein